MNPRGKIVKILFFTMYYIEIKKFYDRGGKRGENYFDLFEYFYDCEIFVCSDDEI